MGSELSIEQFRKQVRAEKTCALLNSRQSRRPCGCDKWVGATKRAVESLADEGLLFLTSVGQNTWELAAHLVNRLGGRQIVVIPSNLTDFGYNTSAEIEASFRFDPDRTTFVILESVDLRTWQIARDELLGAQAKLLVPISVRREGNLARILAAQSSSVDETFRTEYCPSVDRIRYDWSKIELSEELSGTWDFLTHWTRTSHGPFAGQNNWEYYNSILSSQIYPGSALHALFRILGEGKIRASQRFIRGSHRAVSLTSLRPDQTLPLMRWRRRYGYYSFEPYGISVRKSLAVKIGCREVSYGSASDFERMPERDKPYFQNSGSQIADWRPEAEWRHLDDIDLNSIPLDDIRIITFKPEEVELLREYCPCKILPISAK